MLKNSRLVLTFALLILLSLFLTACSLDKKAVETRWLVVAADDKLVQSGLMAALILPFEKANNLRIKLLPVDPLEALTYARNGGVEVLITSGGADLQKLAGEAPNIPAYSDKPLPTPAAAPEPTPTPTPLPFEVPFAERKVILWSPIVIVGPLDYPEVGINRSSVAKSLQQLAISNAKIISPAREPGLNLQVERLWKLVGLNELTSRGSGYRVLDGDALAALKEAEKTSGYSVIPLDVYINNHDVNKSKIIYDKDLALFFPYEATIRNYISVPGQDITFSRKFVEYLLSAPSQNLISEFGKDTKQLPLYRPQNYPVYIPG